MRLICWYPSATVLLYARLGNYLQSVGVSPQGDADPCTALVVLDNPSNLAVDAIDFPDELFLAKISGNFLDILCDTVCLSIKKSCKRAPKKRAPSTPNKLVRTAWGEPQRTPFGTLTDHALLQEFWSPFARVGRTKRSRPFAHILEPPSPFSKRTALPVHGLRKTVAFTGENHNMAVVD